MKQLLNNIKKGFRQIAQTWTILRNPLIQNLSILIYSLSLIEGRPSLYGTTALSWCFLIDQLPWTGKNLRPLLSGTGQGHFSVRGILSKSPFDRLREQVETCSLTYKYAFSHICPSSQPAVSGNWSYNFTRCHRLTPVLSWRCTVFWSEQTVHFHTLMFEKPYLLVDSTGIACQASVCSDYPVTGND